jgi:hypothetical protein
VEDLEYRLTFSSGFCGVHGPVRTSRVPIVEDCHDFENQVTQVVENHLSLPIDVATSVEPVHEKKEKGTSNLEPQPQESQNNIGSTDFADGSLHLNNFIPTELPSNSILVPDSQILPPSRNLFFEFRLGEDIKSFSGVVSLVPLMKTPFSQDILGLDSLNWTKILTDEKFERAQLDFHGGFTTSKSCVFEVEISTHLLPKLEIFRNEALGCILEGWEFLLLIHRTHYIYPIMAHECGDESNEELLLKGKYFLLGFTKGWRLTQKKQPPSRKEFKKEITSTVNPQRKRPKAQEISKSNFIIKDFGKAKILKPISTFPVPTTTTILKSTDQKNSKPPLVATSYLKEDQQLQQVRRKGDFDNLRKSLPHSSFRPREISPSTQSVDPNGPLELQSTPRDTSPRNHRLLSETPDICDHGISDLTSVPSNLS